MIDFLTTAYRTFQLSQKYKKALESAKDAYDAGGGLDDVLDAFSSHTDSEFDDELSESIKQYFNEFSHKVEQASIYCWRGVSFVEENLPTIAEKLHLAAIKTEEVVPPAVRSLRMGAEKLESSSEDITKTLASAGAFFIKLNLRISQLRHGSRK